MEGKEGAIAEAFGRAKWSLVGWLSLCKEFGQLSLMGQLYEGRQEEKDGKIVLDKTFDRTSKV